MKLTFLGAARQVTGSCYLLEVEGQRLLIDCGMFQERQYQNRNWDSFPVPLDSIDHVLLTHAHLDHSGLLPKLVRDGLRAPILTTAASKDLAEIILQDAGEIQEEDAAFKKKRHQREGRTGPRPVEPLYTPKDVQATLPLFHSAPYDEPVALSEAVSVTFHDAGHILGSAALEITVKRRIRTRRVVFSGDLGQWNKPLIRDPALLQRADYLVMESTYGDRIHDTSRPIADQLCDLITQTVDAGGKVLIPTFAVERAQELVYYLAELAREERLPKRRSGHRPDSAADPPLDVFLDSPMAADVTDVFLRHRDCLDEEALAILGSGERLFRFPGMQLVRTRPESKAINRVRGPCIIMAGSGMCTAGRIKHHLANHVSRPENTIVFVGYQANGTLGRQLVDGRSPVRIHGQQHAVKARIAQIHGCSGHADQQGLLRWMGNLKSRPRRVFLTHGEPEAAETLAREIRNRWPWPVEVPEYRQEVELD